MWGGRGMRDLGSWLRRRQKVFRKRFRGGMAERFKAVVLKTIDGATRPGVRIPLPPPNDDPAKSDSIQKNKKISMNPAKLGPDSSTLVH